jgi:hypothetical protein
MDNKKIILTPPHAARIELTAPHAERIEPEVIAEKLGADLVDVPFVTTGSPLALAQRTIPFRPPLVLYVVLWRTKNGSMHARKPVVLTQDEIAARKEYERLKRERTGRGAIPVLVRYSISGLVRDIGDV